MSVSYLRLPILIWHSEKKALRGHFQEIRENQVHLSFAKVLEHVKRYHRIERPERAEILREQISLSKPYLPQMLFESKLPGHLVRFRININADDLCHERDALSDQQREKTRGTASIKKSRPDTKLQDTLVECRKHTNRGIIRQRGSRSGR